MTNISIPQTEPILVAIDISKARHEVLISVPGKKRRRRVTVLNQLDDFNRLIEVLETSIDDFRITIMKLTGERILIEILEQHAPEELAFMEAEETLAEGESIGMAMLIFAEFIEREKKVLVDSGRMTNDEFKEYIRNVGRYDLPYFARAIKNKNKKGPQ